MSDCFRIVKKGNIALVEFDLKGEKVNKLSIEVTKSLGKVVEELKTSSYKAVILISRKKRIFIAGADIEEIKGITNQEDFSRFVLEAHSILNEWEDLPMMTVAAINGACMGGGLEFALACDFRLASDNKATVLAVPEVKLGLFPGFGGCIRLPRLIGLQAGLNMILTGQNIKPAKARKMGLVEKVLPQEQFEERVLQWTEQKLKSQTGLKRKEFKAKGFMNKFLESFLGKQLVFFQAKKTLLKQTKGFYPAPEMALVVVKKTYGMKDRKKCLSIERKYFCEVAVSDVSKNLINLFFSMEKVKRRTGVSSSDVPIKSINHVAVLGAGVMGGGIAQLAADKGYLVRMKDISNEALALGFKSARAIWSKKLKRRRITKYDFQQKMNHISGGLDFSGFKNMDVVIEAVVEDMSIKKKVIEQTAKECKKDCIIASNTSSLSINEMAKAHPYPQNFLGMHFFNPVHKMPLVEVIRGEQTSDEAVATIFNLCKKMGKTPVVVKDAPAFLVNRLLLPWMAEALFLLEEGMTIETLDRYYTHGFGLPMGPCRLFDEVGLDVGSKVLKIFRDAMGDRIEIPSLGEKMLKSGRLGRKNLKGFYIYEGQKIEVDADIYEEQGLPNKDTVSEQDCIRRGIFQMINEASRALIEDKIVETAQEVDLAMIMGTGFPPFRGGLLKYADSIGVDLVVSELEVYATAHGKRFKPSQALIDIANSGSKFYS